MFFVNNYPWYNRKYWQIYTCYYRKKENRTRNTCWTKWKFQFLCKRTITKAEILAVIGTLFLICIKRGNCTDFEEFFTLNGTGLTILRANLSENHFRFWLRSIRCYQIHTRAVHNETDKLAPIRDWWVHQVIQFARVHCHRQNAGCLKRTLQIHTVYVPRTCEVRFKNRTMRCPYVLHYTSSFTI